MIRNALLLVSAIWVGAIGSARAEPTITVDDSVPFTAKDLSDAVQIRVPASNARIHIARSGNVIVITVGERARALEVDTAEPRHLARVVALVIVGLAESPSISTAPLAPVPSAAPLDAEVPPDAASIHMTNDSTRAPSRYALRASVGHQRTDGGIYTTPLLASLMTAITPNVRFAVTAGVDEHGTHIATTSSALGRLGLEGRYGALGLELGAAGYAFRTCAGDTTTAGGAYGTARIYVPISARGQFVIEAGGYYVGTEHVTCGTDISFGDASPMTERTQIQEYAGHLGIGVEWGL